MAEPVTDPANAIAPPERRRRQRGRCHSSWRASAIHHGTRAAEQCRRPFRRRPGDRGVRRRGAGLQGAGAEPDHRGGDRDGVAARGRCAPQFGRGDRRARPARPRIGGAGRPARVVGQAGGAAPAPFEAREGECARARIRCAQACPHRFSRRARAVTPGRLLRLLFGTGRCPSGPGSRASHRAPAMPGLGPCGLRSLSRAPRPPHASSQAARVGWASARGRCGATLCRRAGNGTVIGPFQPAQRSPGAAGRRPK